MKAIKQILFAAFVAITSSTESYGQAQPVDANGVKVIVASNGDKFNKYFKGDDKNSIRTLIIKDNPQSKAVFDFRDVYKVLSKIPNLEVLDVAGCENLNNKLTEYEYTDATLNIKRLVLSMEGCSSVEALAKICKSFKSEQIRMKMFPKLSEYKLTAKRGFVSGLDSLFINIKYENGFVPVYLPKEGAIVMKNDLPTNNLKCQLLIGCEHSFAPANKNLEGVHFFDTHFFKSVKADKLVVPATVEEIFGDWIIYEGLVGTVNSLVFAEGEKTLLIHKGALNGLKVKRSIVFNRPVKFFGPEYDSAREKEGLDSIVFNKSASLEYRWFHAIKHLEFNGSVHIGEYCGGERHEVIIINDKANLKRKAFGEVGLMKFRKEPTLDDDFAKPEKLYVPIGFKRKLPSYGFYKNTHEWNGEAKLQARTIKVEKPGTLLSAISTDDLGATDSLTIIGLLYETDTKVLTELANNLRYLDISQTIITISPEKRKKDEATLAAFSAFFKLAGVYADEQYRKGQTSLGSYLGTKLFAELASMDEKATESIPECVVPSGLMEGSTTLEEIKLPVTASLINDNCCADCMNLRKVIFPKYLTSLCRGSFSNCPELEELNLPKSVRDIEEGCFYGCLALEKVDLSACTLNCPFKIRFNDKSKIKEYRMPKLRDPQGKNVLSCSEKGVKVFIPTNCGKVDCMTLRECEVHFESPIPPTFIEEDRFIHIDNCTIYCPKGSATTYYAKFGHRNKVVEE